MKTYRLDTLKKFSKAGNLPRGEQEIREALHSPAVRAVTCFVLGPIGTNIAQASERWLKETGIEDKTSTRVCEDPMDYVVEAKAISSGNEVAIFWTCAVYFDLFRLFFLHPDTHPFFISYEMELDEMQLAIRPGLAAQADSVVLNNWRVAAHPSPSPLVDALSVEKVRAKSNSHAAEMCAGGEVELCITTEAARQKHGLAKLHSFGSPVMVFFGGISSYGAEVVAQAHEEVRKGGN